MNDQDKSMKNIDQNGRCYARSRIRFGRKCSNDKYICKFLRWKIAVFLRFGDERYGDNRLLEHGRADYPELPRSGNLLLRIAYSLPKFTFRIA